MIVDLESLPICNFLKSGKVRCDNKNLFYQVWALIIEIYLRT